MTNSINFRAKLINTAQIKKLNPNGTYSPQKISIIEIDANNIQDLFAISDAAKYWTGDKYASNIVYTANCLFHNSFDRRRYKVFAATEQLDNLDNLDGDKILGMTDVKKTAKKAIQLNYIQVNQDYHLFMDKPRHKNIGTSIMDTLKSLYDKIELTAARGSVKDFYIKNGFKNVNPEENKYLWEKA